MGQIRRALNLPFVRAGGAENAFEFEAGDNIFHAPVAIITAQLRIEDIEARGEQDRAHLQFEGLGLLMQIYRVGLARTDADLTLPLLQIKTGLRVNVSDQRLRL